MDVNRIASLLHIAEKSLGFPQLKAIHDAAVAELGVHVEDAKAHSAEIAKDKADQQAQQQKLAEPVKEPETNVPIERPSIDGKPEEETHGS